MCQIARTYHEGDLPPLGGTYHTSLLPLPTAFVQETSSHILHSAPVENSGTSNSKTHSYQPGLLGLNNFQDVFPLAGSWNQENLNNLLGIEGDLGMDPNSIDNEGE
jgi:hypothetical protein